MQSRLQAASANLRPGSARRAGRHEWFRSTHNLIGPARRRAFRGGTRRSDNGDHQTGLKMPWHQFAGPLSAASVLRRHSVSRYLAKRARRTSLPKERRAGDLSRTSWPPARGAGLPSCPKTEAKGEAYRGCTGLGPVVTSRGATSPCPRLECGGAA